MDSYLEKLLKDMRTMGAGEDLCDAIATAYFAHQAADSIFTRESASQHELADYERNEAIRDLRDSILYDLASRRQVV